MGLSPFLRRLFEQAVVKANDIVGHLSLLEDLKNLKIGIVFKGLGAATYGKALSPLFTIAIDIDNIVNLLQSRSFSSALIKCFAEYLTLHEAMHIYMDMIDLLSIFMEYNYFEHLCNIQEIYARNAELMRTLSIFNFNFEHFGCEVADFTIYEITEKLKERIDNAPNEVLKKSLSKIDYLFHDVVMTHHMVSGCNPYDYRCVHDILLKGARAFKRNLHRAQWDIENIEKAYSVSGLKVVIMGIVTGFFLHEHASRLIYQDINSIIEALCYYVPAKMLFKRIDKALLMPVVYKYYDLLLALDRVGFNKVLSTVRRPGCIIEKIEELSLSRHQNDVGSR